MAPRFRLGWRGGVALALIGWRSAFAAPASAPAAILVSAVAPARPVLGADHRIHLAYELAVTNRSDLAVQLESVAALDGTTHAVLSEVDGDDLTAMLIGDEGGGTAPLQPVHSVFLLMDVALPEDADPPRTLEHRVQLSRLISDTAGKNDRPAPKSSVAPTATFNAGDVAVERIPALVLAPPLRGSGWLVVDGCCDEANAHRAALLARDGRITAPKRFAIDFVELRPDGRLFDGPPGQLSSYKYFAKPVLAATEGVVVALADAAADEIPGRVPEGKAAEAALGNYVVIATDAGRYLLYAHLKAGSVTRKVGEPVRTGDTIGLLGNSGDTARPHLEFDVMDSPLPLTANGLPYVFRSFTSVGRLKRGDAAAVFAGGAAAIDKTMLSGNHRNELPLNGEVVGFE